MDLTDSDLGGLDLREVDLKGLDLSGSYFLQTDLRGADLSQTNLEGASLNGAKVSGTYFPKELAAEEIALSLTHGRASGIKAIGPSFPSVASRTF